MSDDMKIADIDRWISEAEGDAELHLERCASDILLQAIAQTETLGGKTYLKGGALMGLVYGSHRQTADLDFTSTAEINLDLDQLKGDLDTNLTRVAILGGYPDILCRVHRIREQPRSGKFKSAKYPALKVNVGYAVRGTSDEERLAKGQSTRTLEADISFKETVFEWEEVRLGEDGSTILVYALEDLIAEKLRALLQQPVRNRYRRQDVYDLAFLIDGRQFSQEQLNCLHHVLLEKCRSRDIAPNIESLSVPEIRERAEKDWHTLAQEVEILPDFETCFKVVEEFYKDLPWG